MDFSDRHRCCTVYVYIHRLYVNHKGKSHSHTHTFTHTHTHFQPGRVFVLVNTWIIEPDSNTPSLQKESWRRRRMRRKRREKESRWPSADRLGDWKRGVFSEGRGLVLLWLQGPLCHTAYQGSPKSQGLMVSMSPQSSSPALAYCHSCFLISQTQSSVTQTVYLVCLPQPGREKEREKNRHTSQDLGTK